MPDQCAGVVKVGGMSFRLGIGIITYNRKTTLLDTVQAVFRHTLSPFSLIVADDGSTDGTREALRDNGIPFISGQNRGIAWNKNRALFWLTHIKKCDVIILLEDDTRPQEHGWETVWAKGAMRHGHMNLAGQWFQGSFVSGSGDVDDPILSLDVSGQCSCFSRQAILFGGLLDTRFRGFGFEHVEHSIRLMRLGYGGRSQEVNGEVKQVFYLLKAAVRIVGSRSYSNPENAERNRALCHELLHDPSFRGGGQNHEEMAILREELLGGAALRDE